MPPLLGGSGHLSPFALYTVFPCSLDGRNTVDYYGDSVTVGLAPRRRSRVPFGTERLEHDVGAPLIPLNRFAIDRLPSGGDVPRKANGSFLTASPPDVAAMSVTVAPLGIRVQAVELSPYHAGLAERPPTRLQMASAFPTCSCPLWLSPLGESDGPEVSLRTSLDWIKDSMPRTAAHSFLAHGSSVISLLA